MVKTQRKDVTRESQKPQRPKPTQRRPPAQAHERNERNEKNERNERAAAASRRDVALRAALASAFAAPPAAEADADSYGKGSAADRLQFGYAPESAAEAVAFHSTISAAAWVAERRRVGRSAIVKRQRLARPNCEPMTSLLKLQGHWRSRAQFAAEVNGGRAVTADRADGLLDMLVAQQRTA